MEIQISVNKRVQLEALTRLYNTKEIYIQWKDMEQNGSEWVMVEGNSNVGKIADEATYDSFILKTEDEKTTVISTFIIAQQTVPAAPEVVNFLEIPISPIDGDIARSVQVYDMKINYSEKWVKLYTRCTYSDGRTPKYVLLRADNDTLLPDGQGGAIGEYDYLYYRIYINNESLSQVQNEIILMRSSPEGGAKWD